MSSDSNAYFADTNHIFSSQFTDKLILLLSLLSVHINLHNMTSTAIILLGLFAFASIVATVALFIRAEQQRAFSQYREKTLGTLLPSRMQAYERITLYLERINPMNMVVREQLNVNTSQELHTLMTTAIRQEFDHNIAMQIYISEASWSRLLRARDEVTKTINKCAKETNPKASSLELGRKILESAPNECTFYVNRALSGLRSDINGLFTNK
jgi:hypothetical protein